MVELDPRRRSRRTSSPRSASARTTCEPRKPLPPVTRVLGTGYGMVEPGYKGSVEPPSRTAVLTDTTAYLPDELIAAHSIHRVSLYVSLDGDQRREIEIEPSEYADFYERLRRSDQGVTTSQPSIGDFYRRLRAAAGEGRRDRLDPPVGGHLGDLRVGAAGEGAPPRRGTRRRADPRLRQPLFRGRAGTGGARRSARGRGGSRRSRGARRGRAVPGELAMWFAIDTLEYLRKGGRIGAAQAWLGSALQIKPILTLGEEITPIERVRTRRRALERLVEYQRQLHSNGADGWVVQHIQDHETARRLVEQGREIFGCEPGVRLRGGAGDRRARGTGLDRDRRRSPPRRCHRRGSPAPAADEADGRPSSSCVGTTSPRCYLDYFDQDMERSRVGDQPHPPHLDRPQADRPREAGARGARGSRRSPTRSPTIRLARAPWSPGSAGTTGRCMSACARFEPEGPERSPTTSRPERPEHARPTCHAPHSGAPDTGRPSRRPGHRACGRASTRWRPPSARIGWSPATARSR